MLGGLLLFGWNRYGAYRAAEAEAAAALYQALRTAVVSNDEARAVELLGELRSEHSASPYADHAAMLIARMELVSDPERAAEELRHVMETSGDPELAMIARLRLARVLAYRQRYDEALELLSVPEPGPFSARIAEVRGDIHAARGEHDAARAAYLQALTAPIGELSDRSFVQMKLDDLPAPAAAAPSGETGS
jgi:predicted negative regulator of RcsB-dependent stress response